MISRFSVCNSTLLLVMILAMVVAADETKDRRAQLDGIKAELEIKRAQFDSLGHMEKNVSAKLRDIEQQAALSGQLLFKINKEMNRVKKSLSSQKVQLQMTGALRDDRRELLKKRLQQIYKMGDTPGWLEILTSGDPSSALATYRNMKALVEYDQHLLHEYRKYSDNIESILVKYQRDLSAIEGLRSDQQSELERRQKTLQTRKRLVERVRKDRGEIEKSISQLESDAREIAGIIENLEAQSLAPEDSLGFPGLEGGKGNLIWPTQGKIMRQFGAIKDQRGIELSNPGIDIQAKMGANVVAASSGEVIYISWLRGYGQFIIINHGMGYFTLYANLSDILVETGDRIRAGELIALVGDSGSLEGPKLHFEVRYKREQLNPMEWLR